MQLVYKYKLEESPRGWISSLLEAADEAETPRSYIYWSGIAIISACVSPNVYINRQGIYKLSPNVFVMLIGESGLGKGFPIWVAKKLVTMVGCTRVIYGHNTIASIIQDLGTTETVEATGKPKFLDSRGFIVSGEFSTLLMKDEQALPIVTELYDTHYVGDWSKRTKTAGKSKLEGVNVTILAGSTPEHFSSVVPEADVKGGFVGRILTVYAEERAKANPLSETEAEFIFPFDELAQWLEEISHIKGAFKFSPEAKDLWDNWYVDIRTRKVNDPTGAVNRLPDNVLKVAMCLSLSRRTSLYIEMVDLVEAIEQCMLLTVDSRRLTGGRGKSEIGAQTHLVVQILYRAPQNQMFKHKLLADFYGQFDVYVLDRIIQTLETAGLCESINVDGKVLLRMPQSAVDNIKRYMERTT